MSIREMNIKEQSLLFAKLARDAYGDEKPLKNLRRHMVLLKQNFMI